MVIAYPETAKSAFDPVNGSVPARVKQSAYGFRKSAFISLPAPTLVKYWLLGNP